MVRNRRLARALSDAGVAELRRQLGYKTAWYGSRLVVADRFVSIQVLADPRPVAGTMGSTSSSACIVPER
jgi:hypothetical protein